eukprot:5428019-Pyramimonas_sp.AAC.2
MRNSLRLLRVMETPCNAIRVAGAGAGGLAGPVQRGFILTTDQSNEEARELELVDSLDPFSEGIVFSVRPPKKSWKNICNLSGGEKTLSSLSLVFALHHYKPTPLYVMDEIDAALDFKNVSIVAHYIKVSGTVGSQSHGEKREYALR